MNTVTVHTKENEIINFIQVAQTNLSSFNENGHKKLFEQFPFTLYKERTSASKTITMQIPLMDYVIYMGHGLIK